MEAHSRGSGEHSSTAPLPEGAAYKLERDASVGEDRKYTIARKLPKAGGWGQVYEAFYETEDGEKQRVAVKTIRPEQGGNPEYRQRFIREQQDFRGLEHENLCCPFDWNEATKGLLWLVMPWVEGDDLYEIVDTGPLKTDRAAALIAQAADGLHALHEVTQKAHCDVHPGNVMVEIDDRVRVIDFGLAKRFGHPSGSPPELLRTRWASPEGLLGNEMTPQSDLYSLGLVLAYALSGKRPERGHAQFDLEREIPDRLRKIIEKATTVDPGGRQKSADKVASELREFLALEGDPVPRLPAPPVSTSRPARVPRRVPVVLAFAAATVVAGAAFVVSSGLASSSDGSPTRPRVAADGLTVVAPPGWRTASVSAADRKLGIGAAVGGTDAIVLVGSVRHRQIPAAGAGQKTVEVALPAGRALRADDVKAFDARRMFVFHTSHGYPTIICRGTYGKSRAVVDAACAKIATVASLAKPDLPIPYPGKAVRRQVADALQGYATARRAAAAAIEGAIDHAEVRAAARKIAGRTKELASGLSDPDLAALRHALLGAAEGWQTAAKAAKRGTGFHLAGKEVEAAEAAIRRARGHLVALGYADPSASARQAT
jgi:serine/threonine protein kinase